MTATLRAPRSRGALSGVLLVLLGLWGALIPFVGPYFHYAYTPDKTWDYTSGRLWLEVLPGLAALVGGVLVLSSRLRPVAVLGAWLAAAGGAWFAVGGLVGRRWTSIPGAGTPVGGTARTVVEQLGFFVGLGVLIVFVAGAAMGRFSLVAARDLAAVEAEREAARPVPARAAAADTAADTASDSGPTGLAALPRRLRLSSPVVRSKRAAEADDADSETASAPAGFTAS
jgi:hypothetical protein